MSAPRWTEMPGLWAPGTQFLVPYFLQHIVGNIVQNIAPWLWYHIYIEREREIFSTTHGTPYDTISGITFATICYPIYEIIFGGVFGTIFKMN